MTNSIIDDYAIEVTRTDSGTYEISSAAENENWDTVKADMTEITDHGELTGWDQWQRVYSAIDDDGRTRWYFVSDYAGEAADTDAS